MKHIIQTNAMLKMSLEDYLFDYVFNFLYTLTKFVGKRRWNWLVCRCELPSSCRVQNVVKPCYSHHVTICYIYIEEGYNHYHTY